MLDHAILCADGMYRCPWSVTNSVILEDHDLRWGNRPTSSQEWFEALGMEIFQAGLAPGTAAARRGALREALCGFHPSRTALLEDEDVDELLLDKRIIRNRTKLVATIHAARLLQGWDTEDWEDLAAEATRPQPADTAGVTAEPVGTDMKGTAATLLTEEAAERTAHRLRQLGLIHVGVGICTHFLARTGMLESHVEGCHRATTTS